VETKKTSMPLESIDEIVRAIHLLEYEKESEQITLKVVR